MNTELRYTLLPSDIPICEGLLAIIGPDAMHSSLQSNLGSRATHSTFLAAQTSFASSRWSPYSK